MCDKTFSSWGFGGGRCKGGRETSKEGGREEGNKGRMETMMCRRKRAGVDEWR